MPELMITWKNLFIYKNWKPVSEVLQDVNLYKKDICLHCKDIKFDTKKREAYAKGILVPLTRKENGILEYLLLNQGRPVSQEELIEHVWDASIDSFSGSIRVHMSSLRKKFKSVLGYDPIVNKIGEGYKLVEGVS